MSKSLVKLIDITLLPAALMVVGKFVGLLLTVSIFQIEVNLNTAARSILSLRPAVLEQNLILLSTYSDLFSFIFLAIGFSIVLIQATHFHDTHINPRLLIRLSNHDLTGLVRGSFRLYHSAAIWTIINWISTILIWINVLNSLTQIWVGVLTFVASITFTSLLLQDVYREIQIGQQQIGQKEALA